MKLTVTVSAPDIKSVSDALQHIARHVDHDSVDGYVDAGSHVSKSLGGATYKFHLSDS